MPRAVSSPPLPPIDDTQLLGCTHMRVCPGCGTTAEAGRFCPTCGAVLADPPHDAPARATATPEHNLLRQGAAEARLGSEDLATATTDHGGNRDRPAASLVGRTVGDFVIEGVIGGGSFGTVYRGRQLGLDRPVAIKVPTYEIAADPVQARRFAREARAAARIVHPGVVAIYAVGELDDGRPYLAMQRIDGEPLDQILGDGPLPAVRALRIARSIASALSDTHAAAVVHRDLKPSNIVWRRDRNGDDQITIVDFGIAVCKPGNADATRLTTGGVIGTPHYMSPEQAQGEPVDARSDLYALGCILFELITGEVPFDGSGFEVLLAHINQPAPRASERHSVIPDIVDRLISRLLQKKPDDRPVSADAVVVLIDEAIAELSDRRATASTSRRAARSRPGTRPGPSQSRRAPRHRWLGIAALAVLALSGAGFAAFRLRSAAEPTFDEPEPSEAVPGKITSAAGEPLRLISRDDGELIIRTLVPEVIHAGIPTHAHLEIKTKLGGQFSAKQVVITIEDPHHNATAQTAVIHNARPGHYGLRHTFAEPGHYIIRIFPSETESMSMIDLDVVP
jgi:serine/threonine protein kinase